MTATGAPDERALDHARWSASLAEGKLLGLECTDCEWTTATPVRRCGHCGSADLAAAELPGQGTVHTETTVQVAPAGFERGYQVAIVEVGDTRVMARLEGSAAIGDKVELVGAFTGGGSPVPLFTPR